MVPGLYFVVPSAMHASSEARAYREYLHYCRVSRFADDCIVGDCVARRSHLSAFAGLRKADNLFDCEQNPVQAAMVSLVRAVVSTDSET
jgi:hypothetical protein